MRTWITLISVLSISSFGDDFRFKSSEYAFRKNDPIFVFDISKPNSDKKVKVCCTTVKSLTSNRQRVGTTITEDASDCSSVESFGSDARAFITPTVLDGKTALYNPSGSEAEQVRIKGKVWVMSDGAKAIAVRLDSSNGAPGGLNYICRAELRPLERLYEMDAPSKTIFCKPIKPIEVQMIELDGHLSFSGDGKPEMIETVVCPLPRNCIKPEWEITPSMRFIPGTDLTTAHAGLKDSSVVHREPPAEVP